MPRVESAQHLIYAIVFAGLCFGVSVGMNSVVIPLMLADYGLSRMDIGILTALDMGATMIMAPLVPYLARRFSISHLIFYALLLRAIVIPALPLVAGMTSWAILLLTIGIGGAGYYITIQCCLNSLSFQKRRGVNIALYFTFWAVGASVGPYILYRMGDFGEWAYLVSAAVSLIGVLPILYLRSALPVLVQGKKIRLRSFIANFTIPVVGGFASDYIFFSLYGFIVLYGVKGGMDPVQAGFLITAMLLGTMLLEVPIGWLCDRFPRRYVMPSSAAIILIITQILPLLPITSLFVPLLFAFLCGALAGLYTASLALLGDHFKGADIITANSAFIFISSIGAVCGLLTTGFAMDHWGKDGLTMSIALAVALYLLFSVGYYWRGAKIAGSLSS